MREGRGLSRAEGAHRGRARLRAGALTIEFDRGRPRSGSGWGHAQPGVDITRPGSNYQGLAIEARSLIISDRVLPPELGLIGLRFEPVRCRGAMRGGSKSIALASETVRLRARGAGSGGK